MYVTTLVKELFLSSLGLIKAYLSEIWYEGNFIFLSLTEQPWSQCEFMMSVPHYL